MVIDFHTHIFPDSVACKALRSLQAASHIMTYTDGTLNGLKASMTRAGIDISLVMPVATKVSQVPHINDSALRINQSFDQSGILSFGSMHPAYEDYKAEMSRLKASGIKGIKLHPPYQGVPFDDIRYCRILEEAGRLGLIVLIHAGIDIGLPEACFAMPGMIARAIKSVGPVTLVLAHMGGWRCWNALEDLTGTGVYLDTSFSLGQFTPVENGIYTKSERLMLDPDHFCRLCRIFGTNHVLFGTDSPWADQESSLKQFLSLSLSRIDKEKILWMNALRLLNLTDD